MRLRASLVVVLVLGTPVLANLPAAASGPHARLIHVDVFKQGGKPSPRANCVNDDASAYTGAYELIGWVVAGPLTAHLNTSTVPSSLGTVTATMQAAFTDMAKAASGVPAINVAVDGSVRKATANRQHDLLFGRTGSSIATTYTWRWSDGLIESDVVFNSGLRWFMAAAEGDGCDEEAGAAYDVQNIAAHEFGHVYGLGHPAGARYETMYAYGYTGETLKRSPATGEKNGLAKLYSGP